jgi:hypothetical protein
VAARSKSRTAFVRWKTGFVGSNPTWDMDACVCLFCVCAAVLRRVHSLFKESTDSVTDQETEKPATVQQRVVEP